MWLRFCLAVPGAIHTWLGTSRCVCFPFGMSSLKLPWGSLHAVDIEADSVSMRVVDLLVGISIRRAPTFERYRVVDVYRLYRRPLCFSANRYYLTKGDVRFGLYLSAGTSLCRSNA